MATKHIKSLGGSKRLPDEFLWEAFRKGDKDSFSEIYYAHIEGLFKYGMSFAQDSFLIKESIQELFVDLWSRRESLGTTDNIRFYLLRALRRRISHHYKDKKRWELITEDRFNLPSFLGRRAADQPDESEDADQVIARKLLGALLKLPTRQKEALYHIYYENLSYEEVAALMNVNIKTVYNLSWRGIETLRKSLSKSKLFSFTPVHILMALDAMESFQ